MSFTAALGGMAPNPASVGMGEPPEIKGLPPPPTGKGPIATGGDAKTKEGAGGAAIAALRDLIGYSPELKVDIQPLIAKIKAATVPKRGSGGPPNGQPGIPGTAQMESSPLMDSGGSGAF
jgi:hypothetical protein